MMKNKNNKDTSNSGNKKLHLFNAIFWFKKLLLKKKSVSLGLVVKSKNGPMSEPIIFNNIEEGMEYFRTHP